MRDYTKSMEDEIKEFKKQREKVREIIGQIGGRPTFMKKMFNFMFVALVAAAFGFSLIAKGRNEVLMLEVIVLLVSIKFIYFLFLQARVVHFQFWILSSIEWRINELMTKVNTLLKETNK